ncbi:MAG TPA: carbon storage regulator [Alphaproteobacteria bacterium]|nr:carbon storage regulator [Alphaproteobacteria bacterium]
MLFLNRKVGESIVIDGKIEICIQEIGKKTIKLGIIHPDANQVLRKELFLKIQLENKKAAESFETLQLLEKQAIE